MKKKNSKGEEKAWCTNTYFHIEKGQNGSKNECPPLRHPQLKTAVMATVRQEHYHIIFTTWQNLLTPWVKMWKLWHFRDALNPYLSSQHMPICCTHTHLKAHGRECLFIPFSPRADNTVVLLQRTHNMVLEYKWSTLAVTDWPVSVSSS